MKISAVISLLFLCLLALPYQLQAREIASVDGESFGFFNKLPSPTNSIENTKRKTEEIYNNIFESIFNFNSSITNTPSSQNPGNPTSSPNPGNNTSTPTKSRTNESQYADKIIEIIHKNCTSGGVPGIVTILNRDCLDSLKNGIMNDSEIAELKQSTIDNYFLQCVPCARVMSKATGGKYNGYDDAKTHIGKEVAGYEYISIRAKNNLSKIVPGSIFVVNTGAYGHIGYITEVIKDDNGLPVSFRAFECNLQKNGYVSHERILSIYAVTGFQVPK
ncbi:MAG: CHAP domain-containing protein [Candidatus Roizmanbacteria bacterium]|nr:CHAP domain-containing protein [Candidatus Roizmanbacteria bacterium]